MDRQLKFMNEFIEEVNQIISENGFCTVNVVGKTASGKGLVSLYLKNIFNSKIKLLENAKNEEFDLSLDISINFDRQFILNLNNKRKAQ